MFSFIEEAIAERRMIKAQKELEESGATMESVVNAGKAISLLTAGVDIPEALCKVYGESRTAELTEEEKSIAMSIEEAVKQDTELENGKIIGEMVSRVFVNEIDPIEAKAFLKKCGYSEKEIKIYYKGIMELSNTPLFSSKNEAED